MINKEKSVPVPMKSLEFLGMTIHSNQMTWKLSDEKVQEIKDVCQRLMTMDQVSIRELA